MNTVTHIAPLTLEEQRAVFSRSKFLAMPIAGTIAWAGIGLAGAFLPTVAAMWAVFIGAGSIFYLGLLVARFTREDLLSKTRPRNVFDRLFMLSIAMCGLGFCVAIPFATVDPTSAPLSVGVLAGLMWLTLSGIIQHWVGYFHSIARTTLVMTAWFAFPNHRFTIIPAIIVAIYLVTIYALAIRQRH